MTNQKMRNSRTYKTYLTYATGAATPKKARKFKKPASPSKKRTIVKVEEEEPEPAKKVVSSQKPSRKQPTGVVLRDTPGVTVSKKKTPTTIDKSKGIDLLSDVAALKATQLKKKMTPATTDKSKGIDLLFDVVALEAAQLKKAIKRSKHDTRIHQAGGSGDRTGSKSGVLDEPKGKSVDTNEGTGLKPGIPDVSKADSSESDDDEPQHADDERTDYENQEINDDEEESDDEFVQTPLNYVPTGDETNDESNDVDEEEYDRIDKELYGDVNVRLTDDEKTQEQTTGVQEESGPKMASVQGHLLKALLSTIKSKVLNVIKEYLGTSLDDALYKVLQKHSTDIAKEHSMEHARKHQVPKETITSSDTAALEEFDQETTLFNTMTNSKSFNKSPKHRALYHALMKSILKDEDAMDEGVADKLKKRKPYEVDQDEGPTAGSDRGLKRQRTSKGTETSKNTSTSKYSSKGKIHRSIEAGISRPLHLARSTNYQRSKRN
ncbi:hypothetical protein Tco_0718621 [Tanacetum coccineum]